ncbi:sperm mitochondrial-associated cysteine-rich protein-like [Tribolium madens]|uniref:sperm mitochondrial-associated cysteine-rich protein-like n=1 Tax=Tribolium madens TaxID=41895 RepID=UPI001CF75A7A|nr:sperm mitochondrial-associated cysteine-rich protein-like [Tribolium madens]
MPCCNCDDCSSDGDCFPPDFDSLKKWHKDFNNLRQQWSDLQICGNNNAKNDCCKCCCCCKPKLVKGRFGLAWISETPQKRCCTPCGWQLEICDTPSRVECQCKKMEQWASCPPVEGCKCCLPKPKCCPPKPKCCSAGPKCCTPEPCPKLPCCSIKVMPFKPREECCCNNNCKTNDKAVATDNCCCSENKPDCPPPEQDCACDDEKEINATNDTDDNNNNNDNSSKTDKPRSRSRGRRRRK